MIDIKPGHILDPEWRGPRCTGCGRMLGEGQSECGKDAMGNPVPDQTHLTMASVPADKARAFFVPLAWSNAQQEAGGLLEALEWMRTTRAELNGMAPLDALKGNYGLAVIELQHAEWPRLAVVENKVKGGLAELQSQIAADEAAEGQGPMSLDDLAQQQAETA